MANRYYSNTAVETTLASGINNSVTAIDVASASGFPVSYPYTLVLDEGEATEELVRVTAAVGTALTVVRGEDNTSVASHSAGAVVKHVTSAQDFREPQEHIAATAAHGVSGDVVGTTDTQTLSNKTLNTPQFAGNTTVFPGGLYVNGAGAQFELGELGVGTSTNMDFHSSVDVTDYDVRFLFSGGTASVGQGDLDITAASVQINGDDVVTRTATQTLTGKTIDLTDNTLTGTLAEFSTAVSDADLVGLATAQTLTNKTIDLTDNTVTGTLAEFSAAVSDADLVGVASAQTLTNKTLTSPQVNGGTLTGVTVNGASSVYTATAGGMGVNAGGTCEIILGYAGSGGLSIAQAGVATHGNGVVLWVSGNSLYARHSNGADSLIS